MSAKRFPISRGQSTSDSDRHESCATCYFWNPWFPKADVGTVARAVGRIVGLKDSQRGECRRHAPTGSNHWHWTDENDWCGDYEQVPESSDKPAKVSDEDDPD